jgi:tetratricopeptide (TPR) repeat protein
MLPAAGGEVKRNDPCPCGSGKKYKKCCLGKAVVASPPADEPVRTADSGDVTQKALAAHLAGQLDVAVALFRQVLKSKPRDANAMVRLGMVLRDRGEAKEAMKLIRRAIGISPRRADYHAGLSDVLFSIGQMDESLRSARRALDLNPRCVLAHRLEARWYERHNQLEKAITSIESAMSIEPGDTQVELVWAQLQKRTGRPDEARERLEAIVGTETDHELLFRAWKDLSLVLDRLGDYDAAFEAMERGGDEKTKAAAGQRGDPDVLRRKIKSYREGITPELVGKWTRDALPDDLPAPAFLVGFPRSGTTMTEQVLAAHPQVETSG